MRPEYDFAPMKGGVRGKYVTQYRAGTNLVLLDPKLAEAFPTAAAVNDALRAVLKMAEVVRLPNKTLQPGRTNASRLNAQIVRQRRRGSKRKRRRVLTSAAPW